MKSIAKIVKILVHSSRPWPEYQDFSFHHLTWLILLPFLLLNVTSAYFTSHQISTFTIISAFVTPIVNIAFSALALGLMSPVFKGFSSYKNSLLIAYIANLPFILLMAISFHVQSQFIWLGLLYSIYLLWWGSGFLLNIVNHRRIQFILFSLIFLALFWIISIIIIKILIDFI